MTTWHMKLLGDGVDAFPVSQHIMDAFEQVYLRAGSPAGFAVFSRYDLDENEVSAYFTPEAAALANLFQATPCEKPVQCGRLGLLVGRDDAREKYFGTN